MVRKAAVLQWYARERSNAHEASSVVNRFLTCLTAFFSKRVEDPRREAQSTFFSEASRKESACFITARSISPVQQRDKCDYSTVGGEGKCAVKSLDVR